MEKFHCNHGNTLQVLMNAISTAMGRTLSFEESGEAVYAAMVKVGVKNKIHVHKIATDTCTMYIVYAHVYMYNVYVYIHVHVYTK